MDVFRNFLVAALLLFSGCYSGMEYVVHGGTTETETETETIIKYIVTEPEADIWIDSFTQVEAYEAIDIVWVIDGSCSMMAHQTRLLSGIEHMMNNLPPDVNWRLKMITSGDRVTQATTFPLTRGDDIDDALAMYKDLPNDGMEKGFDAIKSYIQTDAYARTWMREDAALLTVFVSDEREQSIQTVADFVGWYGWIRPSVYLSFIGNVENEDTVCPYNTNYSTIGRKYMDAVNHFSGTIIDICETDWSAGVDDATQNIEPIEEWELTHVPYVDTIVVFEDNVPMDPTNWTYDPVDNVVEFDTTPAENALVEIGYAIKYYSMPS